jgi:hypothetical protein
VLSVINGVGGVIFTAAWPDLEDRARALLVSIVIGTLLVTTAWFLSNGNRWGAIAALVLNALNILLAIPEYFDPQMAFIVGGTITVTLSALTLGLALSPGARAFWSGASHITAESNSAVSPIQR